MQKITIPGLIRSHVLLLLALALGVLGGFIAARACPSREIGQLMPMTADPRYTAFLVMRPEDCDGNLDVLELFQRSEIRERVRLGGIVVLGSKTLASDAVRLLRERSIKIAIWNAGDELHRRLLQSGWHQTPFVLVLNPNGYTQASLVAPQGVSAYLAFAATLQALPRPE